ncbi:retrovirus-related pol polyprotein from transposon TNT 1-94 [Tanacetum coccineum]
MEDRIDKEVNQAARDSDDALVYCVENTVEDHIMDSGASFHATYCKEELERFKLRSGKVQLADDKTLDIAGVEDVVLKTYVGTSWTLKDVRYIPGLKRRLISARQLDEEGYHVGIGDQQWKVAKGSLVVAHGNKCGSLICMSMLASKGNVLDVRKVDIYFCKPVGLGKQKNLSFMMSVNIRELQRLEQAGVVVESPLQFGVAKRLSRTFRAESTGIHVEAPKILWADSVSTTYLIYRIPYVLIGLHILEEEWQGKDTSLTHLKMKCDTAFEIRRVTRLSEAEISHLWTRFMEPENNNIVAEHELSSKITQSPGGSSNTSEGFKNNKSFEDSGRSNDECSKDGEYSKEGGSKTLQVRRSTRESRASVRYSPSANYFLLTENGEPDSYSEASSSKESIQWKKAINEEMVSLEKNQTCSLRGFLASWAERKPIVQIEGNYVRTDSSTEAMVDDMLVTGFDMSEFNKPKWQLPLVFKMKDRYSEKHVLIVGVTTVEWESRLQKSITMVLIFVEDSWNKEPCRDVHQVGDEREVEVMRLFKWHPSELM